MPTDVSRSREGENQRSDQTQREGSTGNGRIRDFIKHQSQLSDRQLYEAEQRKEKGMMTLEMERKYTQDQRERWDDNDKRAIQEIIKQRDGKTSSGSEIQLGYQEGLRGGGPRNTSDYFDNNEELNHDDWTRLERKLKKAEKAFNTFQYIKNGEGEYSQNLMSDAMAHRERTGEKESKYVMYAVQTAVLEYDIEHLENGLQTVIGTRGVKLSGGQAQRTAAARMLVRNPELLVFDDLSSALDVTTEQALW